MKITWIGQAGLIFDSGRIKIMIDPYLSNSVEKVEPNNFRRVPVNEALFDVQPDVMIFTHDHLDHYDPETAPRFLEKTEKKITVLSPRSVYQKVRMLGGGHNYVEFNRYTEWTEKNVRFTAVKAAHSDPQAIGVLIEDIESKKTYYITGDTLYNSEIFGDLPEEIEAVFFPINGVGNNMNVEDAQRFAKRTGTKKACPLHVGMFDEKTLDTFKAENRVILNIYEETEI